MKYTLKLFNNNKGAVGISSIKLRSIISCNELNSTQYHITKNTKKKDQIIAANFPKPPQTFKCESNRFNVIIS